MQPTRDSSSTTLVVAIMGVMMLALVGVIGIGFIVVAGRSSDPPTPPTVGTEYTYDPATGKVVAGQAAGSGQGAPEEVPESVPEELREVTAKSANEKLQNAASGLRLARATLDTMFNVYFGLIDKMGIDNVDVVASVAPQRAYDMNFQILLQHVDKVRSSTPEFEPLDTAAADLRLEAEAMRKLTHEMDDYYHGGAYKKDGHARGPALFKEMRTRMAAYTKARDAFQEQSLIVHRAMLERDLAIARKKGDGGRAKMIETLAAMLDVYAKLDKGVQDPEVRKSKALVIAQLRDARSYMEGAGMQVGAVLAYINSFIESWHELDKAIEEQEEEKASPKTIAFETFSERNSLRTSVMDALVAYYSVR